jgi:hypothetical protein
MYERNVYSLTGLIANVQKRLCSWLEAWSGQRCCLLSINSCWVTLRLRIVHKSESVLKLAAKQYACVIVRNISVRIILRNFASPEWRSCYSFLVPWRHRLLGWSTTTRPRDSLLLSADIRFRNRRTWFLWAIILLAILRNILPSAISFGHSLGFVVLDLKLWSVGKSSLLESLECEQFLGTSQHFLMTTMILSLRSVASIWCIFQFNIRCVWYVMCCSTFAVPHYDAILCCSTFVWVGVIMEYSSMV